MLAQVNEARRVSDLAHGFNEALRHGVSKNGVGKSDTWI